MSLLARLFNVFRPRVLDEECDEELRFHLDERTAGYVREGMSEEAAQIAARARLGDVAEIKSAMLEVRMMNRSFLAGVLTGALMVMVPVGAMMVPASIAWMNQTPTVQFIPVSDGDHIGVRKYYLSPLMTVRCADGKLQYSIAMSNREPPTATRVPPAGCDVVSVRHP